MDFSFSYVVFPLRPIVDNECTCGTPNCSSKGKHPACLWKELKYGDEVPKRAPGAGYGIKTGAALYGSDIVVVDIDSAEAKLKWEELGGSSDTYTVRTARGWHLYFKHPGFPVKGGKSVLAPGIDIQGDGQFVVGPGSPHKSGVKYEEEKDIPIIPAPEWLIAKLRERAEKEPETAESEDKSKKSYEDSVTDPVERKYRRGLYRDACAKDNPSIEFKGGDEALLLVVSYGSYDLRLPFDDVYEITHDVFDPRCVPTWGDALFERVDHNWKNTRVNPKNPWREPPPAGWLDGLREKCRKMKEKTNALMSNTTLDCPETFAKERALRVGNNGVRLPTGLPKLDSATRGGIPEKKVIAIGGAPGAGKTAMLVQLAFTWLGGGIPVSFICADEDADGVLIRFGQLAGLSRESLEAGDPTARSLLASWCESVPFLLYDVDETEITIEKAAEELRVFAGDRPSVLIVDSIQTVRPSGDLPKGADLRTRTNAVIRSLKSAAKKYGHIVLASSELSKSAYRNKDQTENTNLLSAFKESGDIEYGVGLAVVLINPPARVSTLMRLW